MLVSYQGKSLWIEGDDAYSVEDVKNRHNELLGLKSELQTTIVTEEAIVTKHLALKDKATKDLGLAINELEGVDYILNRIIDAEHGNVMAPSREAILNNKLVVNKPNDYTKTVEYKRPVSDYFNVNNAGLIQSAKTEELVSAPAVEVKAEETTEVAQEPATKQVTKLPFRRRFRA